MIWLKSLLRIKFIKLKIHGYGVGANDKRMDLWTQVKEVNKTPSIHSY